MNLEEATLKALQEDDVQDYLANEEALAKQYKERLFNQITSVIEDNFNKLKTILDDGENKVAYDGFYYPEQAISILQNTDKQYHLNSYMDLTISNILNMVDDSETVQNAINTLFEDYDATSALSWGDNFLTILSKLDFNAREYNEELKEDVQPNTYYYEVHIVENEEDMSGFSVFFTSTKEMDEDFDSEAIIAEAIKQNKIDNEDARYCDYVRQIDEDEYKDATRTTQREAKTEAYTAREQFDAVIKKYSDNDKKEIKVVAETEHYILTAARNKENSEGIYLSVTTGKDELDMLPDVYIEQDYKGTCKTVQINWGAFGNCNIIETLTFIKYLKEAIEFAKQIEGKDFSNEI